MIDILISTLFGLNAYVVGKLLGGDFRGQACARSVLKPVVVCMAHVNHRLRNIRCWTCAELH